MATAKFYGTGRRKKSIARVYLVPGTGKITINKRDIDEYLGLETLKVIVRQPLVLTDTEGKFDVIVNVKGGGYTGQAGAIRHGISRALLEADADYRPVLKKAGFLSQSSPSRSAVQQEIIQSNIRKEQISPKTSCFRGFLYIPINLSDTTKTHKISTVTNT